jgi:hypothetical protein
MGAAPEASDIQGRAMWIRIARAVKELLHDRPPGEGEAVY